MKAGTYEQLIESETAKLDAEYHKKQIAVEHNVTAALEDEHLKNQMELRQRQLVEIAHIVAMYTDKDTLEKLNSSTGKTQEEELLEVSGSFSKSFVLTMRSLNGYNLFV